MKIMRNEWLNAKEIARELNISLSSAGNSLRKLRKRNEIKSKLKLLKFPKRVMDVLHYKRAKK